MNMHGSFSHLLTAEGVVSVNVRSLTLNQSLYLEIPVGFFCISVRTTLACRVMVVMSKVTVTFVSTETTSDQSDQCLLQTYVNERVCESCQRWWISYSQRSHHLCSGLQRTPRSQGGDGNPFLLAVLMRVNKENQFSLLFFFFFFFLRQPALT